MRISFFKAVAWLAGCMMTALACLVFVLPASAATGFGYWLSGADVAGKIEALGAEPVSTFSMPVLYGARTTGNFGQQRTRRIHEGEDIMAQKGTPVVSPTDAVVISTMYNAGAGNSVYTANPGKEIFVYYHLDRVGEGVVRGTVLKKGDLIGYVGNTGDAAGGAPHLHFEIRRENGEVAMDPLPRIDGEFSQEEKAVYLSDIALRTLGAVPSPSGRGVVPALTRDLYQGMDGEDVKSLQKFLNANGYAVSTAGNGSPGKEITYFGPGTRAAVIKFQLANKISPAVGRVGPLTRATISTLGN